jgi:hypothetical protein
MRQITRQELFDEFVQDLLDERSGRPAIIVGSSKIDLLLFEILDAYLLPKTAKAKDPDELLEADRPLSTFSSRIKICYRLGLIDESLYKAMEKLRSIRNQSAHSLEFDVGKSPAREHIRDLHGLLSARKSYALTKKRYFTDVLNDALQEVQCLLLTLCVLLEAIRVKMKQTRGHKTSMKIASE